VRGPLFRLVIDLPEDRALRLDALLAAAETTTYSVYDAGGLWRVEVLHEGAPGDGAIAAFERMVGEAGGDPGRVRVEPVPDIDWLAENRRQFAPVTVGRYFIHGTLEPVRVPAASRAIVLDAGLAFGTGRHATTSLCLTAMDRLSRQRRPVHRVLDLGTGAAILAIAAAKTWPASVVASDIDPVAVGVARDNVRRNGVAARVRVVEADGPRTLGSGFDLVFANILLGPLLGMAGDLAGTLAPGGVAVLSGLLEGQVPAVLARYRHHGLYLRTQLNHDGWAALILAG
jgi:ribosomal protein L11 methyltransferase